MTNYRNDAREHFKSLKLTYDKVTLKDIEELVAMLNIATKSSKYWHSIKLGKHTIVGTRLQFVEIVGSGTYFDCRECITFNCDGFIGFCGDADQNNTKPITETFIDWCNKLYSRGVKSEKN